MSELLPLEGQILAAGEWTPQEAAFHIRDAWQKAVDSIVETGRRLIDARDRVGHGNWMALIDLLPFGDSTARKLMQIARHPDLSNQEYIPDLPPSWGTLAVLAQLPPGEIPRRIADGEIRSDLEQAEAREIVGQEKLFASWSEDERLLLKRLRGGETVVLNLRQGTHDNLISWAMDADLFQRIDRRSEWGNPFEMPDDGDRGTVIANYAEHYLPHKPSLLARLPELRGRALGCWCAPEPCHGDILKERAET